MFITPPHEKIIETKKCHLSGREFFVTDRDLEFYEKISPTFAGKKYLIPSPSLCPEERTRRRLSWRNDRGLSLSSVEKGLSMFNSEFGYTSYQPQKYWSDDWSAFDYATDFNFSEKAFPQFAILDKKVPKLARSMLLEENCDYVNQAGHVKDCFWIFEAEDSEKCYFGEDCRYTKHSFDFLGTQHCEFCYEVVDCIRCNNLFFSKNCMDCRDSHFLWSCFDCKNCFGCINLSKKEYCFFNEQLTEEEYKKRLAEISFEKHFSAIQNKATKFFKTQFFREHENKKSENVMGDKIFESQNVFNSFDVVGGKDIHYCEIIKGPIHDCYDISSFGINSSYCYESVTVGHLTQIMGVLLRVLG